ncbi:MAG: cytochrome c3 family protein [Calditrichae bacterium]|nr:cytochrome c3 family protein [Calditrichota bacterium]MCB9059370.1 cytochrome c3 family protein [Calditrichia bacterium]
MLKKVLYFSILAVFILGVNLFGQNIVGSAHDFSSDSWNTTGQICIVCHTTHNADVSVNDAPLWNHETTASSFTPYTSSTLDATAGQPDASSKLCLSCHDGTIAVDNFNGKTSGTHFLTGNPNVGTDLNDDHPVSITYDAALASADGGLYNPTTTNSGLGGTISEDLLIGNQVQCASCHDVHNGSGIDKLLRKSNNASALCLTCHDK